MFSMTPLFRGLAFVLALCVFPVMDEAEAASIAALKQVVANDDWAIISIPGTPGTSDTVATILGDDLPIAQMNNTWTMWRWGTPGSNSTGYERLTSNSKLYAGQAYWLLQKTGKAVTVDLPTSFRQPLFTQVRGCSSIVGCTSIELGIGAGQSIGWNLVGLSQTRTINLSTVRLLSETGACSTGCTINEASAANMMSKVLYRHSSEAVGYESLTMGSTSGSWDGFWLALLPGAAGQRVTLEVPKALPAAQTPDLSEYKMVFNDEFDGPVLNSNKWNTGLLWGPYVVINKEEQLYVDTLGMHEGFRHDPFSFTPQGTLKITASKTSEVGDPPPIPDADDPVWDNFLEYRSPRPGEAPYVQGDVNYLSGMITSYESFKFTHGYVEARVKVPKGRGLWPAFWTLPTHYVADVPEIDIMEYIGQYPNEAYHTYHYFDVPAGWKAIRTPTFETIGPDFSRDFHTFSMSWDAEQIIWYVDGIETKRVDAIDYDIPNQAMYLLANLAVGGTWPESPDANTEFPAVYELDYIRAYKKDVKKPIDLSEYKLVFNDEFSGSVLNANNWTTRFVWGPFLTINDEEQHYVDSNGIDADDAYSPFSVANGRLTIRAAATGTETPENTVPPAYPPNHVYWADKPSRFYREDYTPKKYTSGIITSRDSFQFTHGYAEIRAKIPVGDGLWPAFWALNSYYVGPQPEIDIMEIIGENPNQVAHTYHWTNAQGLPAKSSHRAPGPTGVLGFGNGFHTFGVQWTDDTITWYVDGAVTASFTSPDVSYQVMYVIANLAVGGAFNTVPVDPSKLPAELLIDYIRVYQEKPVP